MKCKCAFSIIKTYFFQKSITTIKCRLFIYPSRDRSTLGAIQKRRHRFFESFDPPPPSSSFLLNKLCIKWDHLFANPLPLDWWRLLWTAPYKTFIMITYVKLFTKKLKSVLSIFRHQYVYHILIRSMSTTTQ